MPDAHAKLSASGSRRWINCPGSVGLEAKFPEKESYYAQEGTLAHLMGEYRIKRYLTGQVDKKAYDKKMEEIKADPNFESEMETYIGTYLDEVKSTLWSYPEEDKPFIAVEDRVEVDKWIPEGFGTCDCLIICDGDLHVFDLKYGKGVKVDPVKNSQLMIYGLGAIDKYEMIYSIERVFLHIVQPRIDNIEKWEIGLKDLLDFGKKIKPIANLAYEGKGGLKNGDWCRFCRAKSRCPERAKAMFKVVEDLKGGQDKETLTNAEISHYLKECDGIADRIKDLEEEALATILKGENIPGFKAVEGRSNRTFKDPNKAIGLLEKAGFDEAVLYERKPLSLSKLEKVVGKKEFGAILKDEIVKPQGKPTLAPESDKRKEFVKDLGFKKLEN